MSVSTHAHDTCCVATVGVFSGVPIHPIAWLLDHEEQRRLPASPRLPCTNPAQRSILALPLVLRRSGTVVRVGPGKMGDDGQRKAPKVGRLRCC